MSYLRRRRVDFFAAFFAVFRRVVFRFAVLRRVVFRVVLFAAFRAVLRLVVFFAVFRAGLRRATFRVDFFAAFRARFRGMLLFYVHIKLTNRPHCSHFVFKERTDENVCLPTLFCKIFLTTMFFKKTCG